MTQKSSQEEAQVSQSTCKHQPGEVWADGCCKELEAKKKAQQLKEAPHELREIPRCSLETEDSLN